MTVVGQQCRRALFHCLSAATAVLLAAACAANYGLVMHSFEFDARRDSPGVEILDYRYGDSKQPGARPAEWAMKENKVPQVTAIHGEMRKGDDLFVKWRVKKTGEVFEDTVDLRKRLPADITNHRIYFLVRDTQLYVYLVTPERRTPDAPADGPRIYRHLRTITLYPDAPK